MGELGVAVPPPAAPADLVAAWPAMCPPVRQRYAATGQPHRARAFALRWLAWEAKRRARQRERGGSTATLGAEMSVLAIRPDHLGDALLATPAFRLLKQALPTARLTVLCGPWGADVPVHCPAVDRVETAAFPGFARAEGRDRLPPAFARLRRQLAPYAWSLGLAGVLAEGRYDVAVNFRPDYWLGAALSALASIPYRLGYDHPEARPFLTDALPHQRLPVGKLLSSIAIEHAAARNLALVERVLQLAGREPPGAFDSGMQYVPTAGERAEAARLWRAHDLDEAPAVVAIHPVPGEPAKRWPAARFALVADHLAGRFGARVVVTGASGDVAEARALVDRCHYRPVFLAGHTSFGVLATLLERCRFALGTDNGAMHLASAMGTPNVRLFGPTAAAAWGPWPAEDPSVPSKVALSLPKGQALGADEASAWKILSPRPCAPCHRLDLPPWEVASATNDPAYPCMDEISVEQVIFAIETMWEKTASRA